MKHFASMLFQSLLPDTLGRSAHLCNGKVRAQTIFNSWADQSF